MSLVFPNRQLPANSSITAFLANAGRVILDKDHELRLALGCLLARGHLLIEDLPGMGKTTMVKVFAHLLNLDFRRVQFTNDLLPGDILGSSVYDERNGRFTFHQGPIFGQLVLGDELNRASPRTQSACLQAMEEGQVSVDGVTYALPKPFFFVGTQNPELSVGTFRLPESQLDRFLMRISIGFPSRLAERNLLLGDARTAVLERLTAVMDVHELVRLQDAVEMVHLSDAIVEYLLDIADAARVSAQGFSPRTNLSLMRGAKAWAFIHGRSYVIPEDVQAVGVAVMGHRLVATGSGNTKDGKRLAEEILQSVPVR